MSKVTYDFNCRHCGADFFEDLTMLSYGETPLDEDCFKCPKCEGLNSRKERVLSNKIGKIVHGVSKGYYGRG